MYQLSISIIITCHNLHEYLGDCVKSVEDQTMRPTEVIILHDGCTPPPVYPGTTTVLRSEQRGVGATRNEGANLATSDNLLFLDADDALNEYFIEGMVTTKAELKVDILYPNVLLWSSWHKDVKMRNAWHESAPFITKKNMLEYNQIVVSSLVPKKLYLEVGGTPTMPILEDYPVWMECLGKGASFAKSPKSVLKYRQRVNSRMHKSHELKNEWNFRIKEKYAGT